MRKQKEDKSMLELKAPIAPLCQLMQLEGHAFWVYQYIEDQLHSKGYFIWHLVALFALVSHTCFKSWNVQGGGGGGNLKLQWLVLVQ